ncbi:hypothetical protein MDA_GLEAN10004512 [Myotis davidii]|uniref:Uncharacterized protein n=1 Tax=Myotis davidii TaxID=225400 RepID=L5LHT7_MYODS|nr:hypothetical protein MDA_GLEAN10004512 [Myotis davidii]
MWEHTDHQEAAPALSVCPLVPAGIAALQPHSPTWHPALAWCRPPHLLHHPACGVIDRGWGPCLATSVPGSWVVALSPAAIAGCQRGNQATARTCLGLLTCSTILPQSCSHQGPSGPTASSLPPNAIVALLMLTMFRTTSWWSAHVIREKERGESDININDERESLTSCLLHAPSGDRACNPGMCP